MNLEKMLNTIRDNASQEYQDRVPEATRTNIGDVGAVLLEDLDLANEFTSALMNKVAFTFVHNKIFKNPLSVLKRGVKPLGDSVEEVFVNYAKAEAFDPEGTDLLGRKLPDVKAIYHTMNRQDKYKVTISMEQLAKAFRSYGDLRNFYNKILNTLYNGDNFDEFILFKRLLTNSIDMNYVKTIEVADPCTSKENATAFIKAIKTISGGMCFPSKEYNGYLNAQSKDTKAITTFTDVPDQLIIIDNATDVAIDVDVLANAFNLSKQEFLARKIKIDAFPNPSIRAMIIDKDFTQIYDDLYQMRRFENGEGLYENYILHHWQTISASCLVNAVGFIVPSDIDNDGTVEEFTITKTLKEGVTLTNTKTKVSEGTSFSTKFKGLAEGDVVTVTMGGTDVTDTNFDGEKISINSVTGDIVITVTDEE